MSALAEARARKAAREEAAKAELEALELEALELEEEHSNTGKLGVDFDVVTTLKGNFVVKRPDFIVAKRFFAKEDRTAEDHVQFVVPSIVFPKRENLGDVFETHGGIAYKLTVSLLRMYEADVGARQGK